MWAVLGKVLDWVSLRFLAVEIWWRWWRLIFWVIFILTAVMGFRAGSYTWVIRPLLSLAGLLLAQEWIRRLEPKHGPKLAFTLTFLVMSYNIIVVFQTALEKYSPRSIVGFFRYIENIDRDIFKRLVPPSATGEGICSDYAREANDASADYIKRSLQPLVEKRRNGTFSAEDMRRENAFLQELQQLEELDKRCLASESPSARMADLPIQEIPPESMPPLPLSPAIRAGNQETASRSGDSRVSQSPPQLEPDRVSLLESLLNPVSVNSGTRIATVFKSRQSSSQVPQLLFGALKKRVAGVIAGAIQEAEFINGGYFDEVDHGRVRTLVKTSLFSRVDYLMIGTVGQQCVHRSSLDVDLVSCDLELGVKLIDRDGAVVTSDVLNAVGAGFSEQIALSEGSGKLAGAIQLMLVRSVSIE